MRTPPAIPFVVAAAVVPGVVWAASLGPWFARSFADAPDGLLRAIALALGLWGLLRPGSSDDLRPPAFTGSATATIAVGSLLSAAWPTLETARAAGFVLVACGFHGAFVRPERRAATGAAWLLLLAALPVGPWIDAVIGWPFRRLVAALAAHVLGGVSVSTVIAVDGGFAHVDVPCAGLRSLWVGAVSLCALALLRRRPVDGRFAAALIGFAAVAIAANVVRVAGLVALGHLAGWPLLAASVHVPLGVAGFAAALAVGGSVLERGGRPVAEPQRALVPAWIPVALVLVGAAPRAASTGHPAPPPMALPAGWTETAPSEVEQRFASERGASVVHGVDPATGAAAVLVVSRSWLAQHAPERCLQAAGWELAADHVVRIGQDWVRAADATGPGGQRAQAVWWYQRADTVTDDVTVRIRDGLTGSDRDWVLVSALVPPEQDVSPVVERLIEQIRRQTDVDVERDHG